jgi:hypothetical protein
LTFGQHISVSTLVDSIRKEKKLKKYTYYCFMIV